METHSPDRHLVRLVLGRNRFLRSASRVGCCTKLTRVVLLAVGWCLSICSYVISHTDVICLGVLVELMMGVCDPTVLNGESGYYLTVLGAALSVSCSSKSFRASRVAFAD